MMQKEKMNYSPMSKLPYKINVKLFIIDVKNIYIRAYRYQYIKSSSLNYFPYRYKSISLLINKLKENVNNALNISKILNLYINKIVIKIKKKC